jgi:hypothetical protein
LEKTRDILSETNKKLHVEIEEIEAKYTYLINIYAKSLVVNGITDKMTLHSDIKKDYTLSVYDDLNLEIKTTYMEYIETNKYLNNNRSQYFCPPYLQVIKTMRTWKMRFSNHT